MPLDLARTQFLQDGRELFAFRRHQGLMLMQGDTPLRPISGREWSDLMQAYPAEVVRDLLTVRPAWFLTEVPLGR